MSKILRRVDEMCAANRITRVDVLCALVRAFVELRPAPPALEPERKAPEETRTARARVEAAIRHVMRSRRRCTVRELKAVTNSKLVSVEDWDKSFKALCDAGEMRVADEPGARGQTRKVVTLTENVVTL
jgi:hypothetical protein